MAKYWIAVACREHVQRAVVGCFAQVCHGKPGPLRQMTEGDWIVYYSPTEKFQEKLPFRRFTAIGRIKAGDPYQARMSDDFNPWRIDVAFVSAKETPIEPLIEDLSFIKNKQHWGLPLNLSQ